MSSISTDERVLDRAVFEGLTPEQQHQYYIEHGFLLLPAIVSAEQMTCIAEESGGNNRYDFIDRWPGPAQEALIANPALLAPLHLCYGADLRFFKAVYAEWRTPDEATRQRGRQRLHRDYAPEPGDGDYRNSCAAWCNVGHYLIDLDVDEGALWVVPGSHRLPWHSPANDYEEYAADARMVLAKAGDAVMFHNRTIHAGGVMHSGRPRPTSFMSYRPAWSAPLGDVPEWPEKVVSRADPELRSLLVGQNDGTRIDAFGIARP